MKREIKFKVWLPYRKIMMRPKDIIEIQESQISGVTIGQMKEWVWLQFTGISDKNGMEIYEGDIVKLYDEYNEEETTTQVRFVGGGYVVEWDGAFYDGADMTTIGWAIEGEITCEVIGNIYENPELLGADCEPSPSL